MLSDALLRVVDPAGGGPLTGRLHSGPGGASLAGAGGSSPVDDLYISPGWVDLHTHVYDGVTSLSVAPDRAGLDRGVHLVADAGSAGEATIDGLARYVAPTARTQVRAWLNIGSHGLVHLREVADLSFIDAERSLDAIARHRALVCGVKVRSSGLIVGDMGLQPLELAALVAREAGLPLMVHIGEPPPLIGDVLDRLLEGDVVTHCFHGKLGRPWGGDGEPVPALRRALDRGVRLDVGHGAASFDWEVARRAVACGHPPDSISTDLHVRNADGPVHDLATTMTKLLACGMELEGVVRAVTDGPRRTLGDEPWLGDGGSIRHATVFRVCDRAIDGRRSVDSSGAERPIGRWIVPVATIADGVVSECGGVRGEPAR